MFRRVVEMGRRWVADHGSDTVIDAELGDGAATDAAIDEAGVGGPDRLIADDGTEEVDRDAAVGDHNDNSVALMFLDVGQGGEEATGSVAPWESPIVGW
jgi:hypothetical protein